MNNPQKIGKQGNVIFIACPDEIHSVSPDAAMGAEKFTQRPDGRQVNVIVGGVNCEFPVPDITLKELKADYPHEWNSFRAMKYRRCGKKGKNICHPNVATFPKFLAAFGPKPDPDYTLDRLDPTDLEYAAGKCEWSSKQRQAENKTNTRYLTTADGTCLPVSEWSRRSKIPRKTIHERIRRGWSPDDAVGIKTGGPRSSNQPSKPTRSLFPDNPPAHLQEVLDRWEAGMEQHHECLFLLEWRHIKPLEYIHDGLLRLDVSPEKVIACIVENWNDFTRHSCFTYGKGTPPIPDVAFLKKNIMEARHYFILRGGERLSEELRDQHEHPIPDIDIDHEL